MRGEVTDIQGQSILVREHSTVIMTGDETLVGLHQVEK